MFIHLHTHVSPPKPAPMWKRKNRRAGNTWRIIKNEREILWAGEEPVGVGSVSGRHRRSDRGFIDYKTCSTVRQQVSGNRIPDRII